ncbi:hypothetical protein DAKH74_026910 [Maudiozyma humilis]|uniref:Uncharacterized protein n=1 Tax=Maudiozyma humilis TaxID=51915 RepID=A0AAV5RXC8_MAUHU|nr:hypothetical protein DAKH74_026910 [Kazachstania humilis]
MVWYDTIDGECFDDLKVYAVDGVKEVERERRGLGAGDADVGGCATDVDWGNIVCGEPEAAGGSGRD